MHSSRNRLWTRSNVETTIAQAIKAEAGAVGVAEAGAPSASGTDRLPAWPGPSPTDMPSLSDQSASAVEAYPVEAPRESVHSSSSVVVHPCGPVDVVEAKDGVIRMVKPGLTWFSQFLDGITSTSQKMLQGCSGTCTDIRVYRMVDTSSFTSAAGRSPLGVAERT